MISQANHIILQSERHLFEAIRSMFLIMSLTQNHVLSIKNGRKFGIVCNELAFFGTKLAG